MDTIILSTYGLIERCKGLSRIFMHCRFRELTVTDRTARVARSTSTIGAMPQTAVQPLTLPADPPPPRGYVSVRRGIL